jgi:hypothetical protein
MWKATEEDAVLVTATREKGYAPISRATWPLPGEWKPGIEAKRDHALACALAFEGAAWEETCGFDVLVLTGPLGEDELSDLLNARAG